MEVFYSNTVHYNAENNTILEKLYISRESLRCYNLPNIYVVFYITAAKQSELNITSFFCQSHCVTKVSLFFCYKHTWQIL